MGVIVIGFYMPGQRLHTDIINYCWVRFGVPNPDEQPQAEIWMRAHPAGCSGIEVGANTVSLQDAIAKSPDTVLGERTLKKFAGLPFLLKILSA